MGFCRIILRNHIRIPFTNFEYYGVDTGETWFIKALFFKVDYRLILFNFNTRRTIKGNSTYFNSGVLYSYFWTWNQLIKYLPLLEAKENAIAKPYTINIKSNWSFKTRGVKYTSNWLVKKSSILFQLNKNDHEMLPWAWPRISW